VATFRYSFKCEVCGSVTLVKLQAARWLEEHPVHINCGKCLIHMTGYAKFDHENVMIDFDLDNSSRTNENPQYQCDVSGEFLTAKMVSLENAPAEAIFTPFFRGGIFQMQHEGVLNFQRDVETFIYNRKHLWPIIRRIYDLWERKNYEYLKSEILKVSRNKKIKLKSEIDYLMATHQLIVMYLTPVIKSFPFFENAEKLRSLILNLADENSEALKDFIEYIKMIGFSSKEKKLFERIKAFTNIYLSLIPAISLVYYKTEPDFENMGITTVTFEDLKQFYQDGYEVLTELIEIIVGLNNIKHRGSYKLMKSIRSDIETIDQFKEIRNKGQQLNFIDGSEAFDFLIDSSVDNQLRNAIGHAQYQYDPAKQIIKYVVQHGANNKKIFLAEFAQKCLRLFLCILNINEALYHIRKTALVLKGQKATGVNVAIDMSIPKKQIKKNPKKDKRKAEKQARKKNRNK
jgi:hypothetical protein